MEQRADVVVIGLGPGGEEAAGRLADAGLDVVGIEKKLVGGECPYWGCVPSKMMIRAANLLAEARRVPGMAGRSTVEADWSPVAQRIRSEATDDWNDQVAADRFTGKGGRLIRGTGRLAGTGKVEVDGTAIAASRGVIVATGTVPSIPSVPGLAEVPYWTNREAIEASELPRSLLVLGGGAIGLELSQMFARFGVEVSVLETADRLIASEEPEASELVDEALRREGIDVRVSVKATSARFADGAFSVSVEGGSEVSAEQLLVAAGRHPDLGALGLDTVGIDARARSVPVDGRMRAGPRLWAVGDVTGVGAFTHLAVYQARIAVDDILGREPEPADYRALPRVTFTDPEIGAVGLTERAATERGLQIRVGTVQLPESARGWIHKAGNAGLIKLIEDRERGALIGATSAGPAGGEVLAMLTLAVHARVPTRTLRQMIYGYPTFHRAVEDALSRMA